MAFSSNISKVPKKWRLFILVAAILLIFVQVFVLTFPKSTTVPLEEEPPFPKQQKQPEEKKPTDKAAAPTATPQKQSVLLGFQGFFSKLPQIQHNFSPEPEAYTQLRESRRAAVKKSFLHGWHGYSRFGDKAMLIYR